jgi:predicted RNA binding protein YcfA (HicA-like mRNA interferase family)
MAKLPRVTAKQIIAVLEGLGFTFARQKGSHAIYKNTAGLRATVPVHGNAVLHPKIVKTILNDAGITAEKLRSML